MGWMNLTSGDIALCVVVGWLSFKVIAWAYSKCKVVIENIVLARQIMKGMNYIEGTLGPNTGPNTGPKKNRELIWGVIASVVPAYAKILARVLHMNEGMVGSIMAGVVKSFAKADGVEVTVDMSQMDGPVGTVGPDLHSLNLPHNSYLPIYANNNNAPNTVCAEPPGWFDGGHGNMKSMGSDTCTYWDSHVPGETMDQCVYHPHQAHPAHPAPPIMLSKLPNLKAKMAKNKMEFCPSKNTLCNAPIEINDSSDDEKDDCMDELSHEFIMKPHPFNAKKPICEQVVGNIMI